MVDGFTVFRYFGGIISVVNSTVSWGLNLTTIIWRVIIIVHGMLIDMRMFHNSVFICGRYSVKIRSMIKITWMTGVGNRCRIFRYRASTDQHIYHLLCLQHTFWGNYWYCQQCGALGSESYNNYMTAYYHISWYVARFVDIPEQ